MNKCDFDVDKALSIFPQIECSCSKCRKFCEDPCWPTPGEAISLIEAGFSNRLMLGRCHDDSGIVRILLPARKGLEGKEGIKSDSPCTFLTKKRKCELHETPLKPKQARISSHLGEYNNLYAIQIIVSSWKRTGAEAICRWLYEINKI